MMIPPDPGSSLPVYLSALGETLSIALLGTTLAAVAGAAGQPAGGAQYHSLGIAALSGAPRFSIPSAASIR